MMDKISLRDEFKPLGKRVEEFIRDIQDPKLKTMFKECFYNTLDTTVNFWEDGTTYIITGDIDAMWLRDSSAQVTQYLPFAKKDKGVARLIRGLIARQLAYIDLDPYANSFGKIPEGNFAGDECEKHPYVWERKFELDSLCYPLRLIKQYYDVTGDKTIFDDNFRKGLNQILAVFEKEQDHHGLSDYYHYRPDEAPELSVPNRGHGGPVKVCGLVWSGYRPSDDPCVYGYHIPGNMFISCVMRDLLSLGNILGVDGSVIKRMTFLKESIDRAIEEYGVVEHPIYGKIYAYEVDALGNANLMDDANVPSLLSIPYIGYVGAENPIYQNTRRFILSEDNPYYYSGECITGIGSPHTPENYVWPISLMMQGITSQDEEEVNRVLEMLINSDGGTGFMHEGIYCNDDKVYTRSWFAWANSLFSLFVLKQRDRIRCITKLKHYKKLIPFGAAAAVIVIIALCIAIFAPKNEGPSVDKPIEDETQATTMGEDEIIVSGNVSERTKNRANQLAKKVLELFIDGEIYKADGEIYMYDTYKPWSKESEGNASVWHYTSVVAMTSRMYAITEGEDKNFYDKWTKDLWSEMDWYKGEGKITSYNSSEKRTMYAVERAFAKNEANISGISAVYDDQMWILKEYIFTYQRTGNAEYLKIAEELTETCLDGWDSSINPETGKEFGGITWGPGYASKHTCSNAPLIAPLVDLYDIYKAKGDEEKAKYYLDWAEKIYDFSYSTFRNSNNLYGDLIGTDYGFSLKTGLKETVSHGTLDITEYTYNTGTMLQGGAKLYGATGKKEYLTQAQVTAEAAELKFGLKDAATGLNEYVTTSTLWFNLELLMGYIDLARVDDSEFKSISQGYIENFRKTLDYAYDNYYVDGVLPRNLVKGWTYGNAFDEDKNVMDCAAAAEMYAMLYQYDISK